MTTFIPKKKLVVFKGTSIFLKFLISLPYIFPSLRSMKKSEEDTPVPPLLKSAALWGTYGFTS